jgi:hypothetical protein
VEVKFVWWPMKKIDLQISQNPSPRFAHERPGVSIGRVLQILVDIIPKDGPELLANFCPL